MSDAQAPAYLTVEQALERVTADRGLREHLEAARAHGTSLSRFLGAPVTTRYVYDELGRIAFAEAAPEWTHDDRALALGLAAYEAGLCPGCRHPLAETTAPEAEERFVPGAPTRCHRCTAASQAASVHRTDYHPSAVFYGVRVVDRPVQAELDGSTPTERTTPDAPHLDTPGR